MHPAPTKQTTENNILATLLSGDYYFESLLRCEILTQNHSSRPFTHPFSRSPTHPGKSSPAQSLLCLHVHGALDSSWAVHWTYVSSEGNIHTACKLTKSQIRAFTTGLSLFFVMFCCSRSVLHPTQWCGWSEKFVPQLWSNVYRTLQIFTQLWNHPKNRRWQRCCMTGMCCIRQSHSTHCNSCGYDLISHAAVMWHHTAASRCPAAVLRCHTAAALRQP